ncbi:MAG: permease-like cell division protein FtsX [Candidatus Aenigmatarchaeota archaeon]
MLIIRILREGFGLFRNKTLISLVNIFITFLTTLFIFIVVISYYVMNEGIEYVKTKLDFTVYFKENTSREDINKLKNILENFQGVRRVNFITKETAWQEFQTKFLANPTILKALNELKINPFVDYLVIKADKPEVYEEVASYLEHSPYRAIIDFLTYSENREVINRFIKISTQLKYSLAIFLILIVGFNALIIFNSTLLSIYSQKEEIEIFRLIGAPNYFIRLPFLISQLISLIIGFLLAQGVFILILIKTRGFWRNILVTLNPELFYFINFWQINLLLFFFLFLITIISSSIAIQKYLKI